jgi:hypothetical protein
MELHRSIEDRTMFALLGKPSIGNDKRLKPH